MGTPCFRRVMNVTVHKRMIVTVTESTEVNGPRKYRRRTKGTKPSPYVARLWCESTVPGDRSAIIPDVYLKVWAQGYPRTNPTSSFLTRHRTATA
ncbi:hypothetical protein BCAR13_820050 [Paraburkholderia caribensis]|nr:hypothetical protein BCAR13_820050 [Paraburkholderia caribensis]